MALGLGGWDPYVLGWGFSALHLAVLAAAVALVARDNRLGLVLIACTLAYDVHALESTNLWDYLVDPFLFIAGAMALTVRLVALVRARAAAPGAQSCPASPMNRS
jgi:hypothetical protein